MRILLDLQGVQSTSRFRGIGRYSLSLALAMARNAGKHEIWIALNGAFPDSIPIIRHAFNGLVRPERIRIFEVPAPVAEFKPENAWRVRAAEIIREQFLQQLKPDIVHVSSLFEGYRDDAVTSVGLYASELCTAVTLYDLIPLLNQRDYLANDNQRNNYLRKVESLKKANLLLSISESSRSEAIEALYLSHHQVVSISASADERFSPITLTTARIKQLRSSLGITRKMVMYAPGGFDQRKNFEGLIKAYSMLSQTLRATHQLVIVGDIYTDAQEHLKTVAKEAGLTKNELVITGYISDNELVEFYNLATLFVFPSKHEGFGLPVLEAMSCGTPVIGSNVTSIPEVIGLPDALFDPSSAQDISNKIAQALSDKAFLAKLSAHGLNQAKHFSWDQCAKRAIHALEQVVQTHRAAPPSNTAHETIHELTQSIAKITNANRPTDADLARVAECIAFNTGRSSPRQLLLDISVIVHGDAKSGIQRVVRSLLRELIENPPSDTEVRPIYFDGACYKYANAFTTTSIGSPVQDGGDNIVEISQNDIYLALDLNAHLTAAVHDIHLRWQRLGIELYFIIYDILLVQHPEWWPQGTSAIFDAWLRSISQTASGLICISEAVAEEVREWLENNPQERITGPIVSSFHLGADFKNSLPSKGMPHGAQTTLAKLDAFPSFLMVGTIEPRKGHAQTLAAFQLLWERGIDINLVIVGKQGWLVDNVVDNIKQHSELNKHLFWLEGISDEYLEKVYLASSCLIAPSKGEGFGLPLIEAAQHGLPIIARDIAVFREVAGKHAFYFTGLAPEKLASAITNWLILKASGRNPSSKNLPYLSWKESALQLKQQIKSFKPAEELTSLLPNTVESPRKKLYVDISDLVQKDLRTGIQRVTRSILSALLNAPPEGYQIEPVYATPTSSGYFEAKRFIQRTEGALSVGHTDSPISPQPGDIFLGLDFVARIITAQQQYLKCLHYSGVRIYFVVYDLLPILLPHAFKPEAEAGHRQWLKEISAFDGAICISKAVKTDLDTWLSAEAVNQNKYFRTDWFHLGADVNNSIPSMGMPDNAEHVLNQLALHPAFLMVGTIEPRKEYSQALAAFETLWRKGVQVELVIVGKEGWMCDDLVKELRQHKELNRHLFWLEGISDEYLENVYAASSCLLAASESEGFGLPLIEAAQHNKPIIARDIPVFREVAGDHAFYFNGSTSEDLANAITEWLELFQRDKHPKSRGMPFLTWQESSAQLVKRLQLI